MLHQRFFDKLSKSSFVLLESNYDPDILKYSKYPYQLKQRIAGPDGHLSNYNSGDLVSKLMKTGLSSVMLGHLSKENNFQNLLTKLLLKKLLAIIMMKMI